MLPVKFLKSKLAVADRRGVSARDPLSLKCSPLRKGRRNGAPGIVIAGDWRLRLKPRRQPCGDAGTDRPITQRCD
jgi:hypothetical protein